MGRLDGIIEYKRIRENEMKKVSKQRMVYALLFIAILLIEIFIALYVHDNFIRPYGGDILVTVLLCCFIRIFFPNKVRLLPLWVFLFALAVEIGQHFDYVSLLGLGKIKFFRILMGTSFSFADVVCYAVGCAVFFVGEKIAKR